MQVRGELVCSKSIPVFRLLPRDQFVKLMGVGDEAESKSGSDTDVCLDINITPFTLGFFLTQTGIADARALREHVLEVQNEAVKIHPYPCIRTFDFVKLRISTLPSYNAFLEASKHRADPLFLDVGACFGTDLRKVATDGFPVRNLIGIDLRREFWDLGHKLYRSTEKTFPATFIHGDILDDVVLSEGIIRYGRQAACDSELKGRDPLSLTSLNPLQGRIDFIYVSNLFHLFTEAQQVLAARKLASLLSPIPGSMIFGAHMGRPQKGLRTEAPPPKPGYLGSDMFCHSAESWKEMWEGEVFERGTVKVETELVDPHREDLRKMLEPGAIHYQLLWSVTRL
ncbi:hypothetical protein SCHPADRAFT_843881 [Schizopora paradoxa]|uniref:Methyltransferase domain-containing protein n=1 Tax=Schizopora paradoxa TaxID=27342 RepID=A0A0H2SBW7_9AGAM|nr:hypothetical protein SCHPADRAFT_843881 [Schizopora paradoxa]